MIEVVNSEAMTPGPRLRMRRSCARAAGRYRPQAADPRWLRRAWARLDESRLEPIRWPSSLLDWSTLRGVLAAASTTGGLALALALFAG